MGIAPNSLLPALLGAAGQAPSNLTNWGPGGGGGGVSLARPGRNNQTPSITSQQSPLLAAPVLTQAGRPGGGPQGGGPLGAALGAGVGAFTDIAGKVGGFLGDLFGGLAGREPEEPEEPEIAGPPASEFDVGAKIDAMKRQGQQNQFFNRPANFGLWNPNAIAAIAGGRGEGAGELGRLMQHQYLSQQQVPIQQIMNSQLLGGYLNAPKNLANTVNSAWREQSLWNQQAMMEKNKLYAMLEAKRRDQQTALMKEQSRLLAIKQLVGMFGFGGRGTA